MDDTRREEDQARRAAKRVGLQARKSRWRTGSIDNLGEFMIVDPRLNCVVAGARFDLTADDVIALCAEREPSHQRRATGGQ
jgi:hypothetical protein